MLGFHIYVGLMEGNPCFFRINACFTTFCDPITSGCQGFQEWIALYSTSNKLVQAQTRASTNEDEIGYQSQKASPLLDWKASSFKNIDASWPIYFSWWAGCPGEPLQVFRSFRSVTSIAAGNQNGCACSSNKLDVSWDKNLCKTGKITIFHHVCVSLKMG